MSIIPWIALAVAVDAEGKASSADRRSKRTKRQVGKKPGFVIVRPVHLVDIPLKKEESFLKRLLAGIPFKQVLEDKPWAEFSLRVSDIESMKQRRDDDGKPFVRLRISAEADITDEEGDTLIGIYIPGTLQEVTEVVNAAGGSDD